MPEPEEIDQRKEDAKIWGKRIETAKKIHREKVILWAEKVFKEYGGDADYDQDTGEKYDQVAQVIQAVEESIQPHLYFQAPKFNVTATKPEWEKRENLVEAVINHEYRDVLASGRTLDMENELVVLDARLLPFGVTKTSYEVEGDILSEPAEQGGGLLDKVKSFVTGAKPEMVETPVITKEKGHITERKDPLKILLDYRADHISKQGFTIEIVHLKKDKSGSGRYEQDKISELKPDIAIDKKYSKDTDKNKELEKDGYELYEIHDYEKRVIHTYSQQLKDFVEYGTPYPVEEGSQFSFLWFVEVPNEVYPIPPIKFYRKRATEFSYIYTQVSKQIDKFMPKIGVDTTKLSPTDKEKLKAGGLATIFGTVGAPANAVQQFNFSIQKELFEYMAMIKELMNLESGLNQYEVGQPSKKVKATEANQIQQGTQARRFKPKKRVKDFILCQGNTILKTLQKNQSIEKFIKVLGPDLAMDWWKDPHTGKNSWTNSDIPGDYNLMIDVETMVPQDSALKRRQDKEALDVIMNPRVEQLLLMEKKQVLFSPTFEKYAKENLGIKDRDQIIKDLNLLDPSQEHGIWANGQYPPVNPKDDHKKHIAEHLPFMNSALFNMAPHADKLKAAQHLALHEKMQAQKEQEEAGGGEGGGGPMRTPVPDETKTMAAANVA